MHPTRPDLPIRICCVLLPRFNMLNLSGLLEPPRIANYLSHSPIYQSSFLSVDGSAITSSNGLKVECEPLPEQLDRKDVILVLGSWGSEHYRDPLMISWLRKQAYKGLKICSVDIGAYILAQAGLLTGKDATLHWSCISGFQERFHDVNTVEQLFTIDGNILTCSGGTGVIDLMLHLIEQTHGVALSGEISDQMMHYPVRAQDARQRVTLGQGTGKLPRTVQAAVDLIQRHIDEPLTIPEIASKIGLSQRHLIREFSKVMNCSVVQFAQLARLQHARGLLVTTGMSVREISAATGFNSMSYFSYAFKKCFGKRPRDYRNAWPEQDAEPHWPGTLPRFLGKLDAV